jgi:hypothetical protein
VIFSQTRLLILSLTPKNLSDEDEVSVFAAVRLLEVGVQRLELGLHLVDGHLGLAALVLRLDEQPLRLVEMFRNSI